MILVFNKADVSKPDKVKQWLSDYNNYCVIDLKDINWNFLISGLQEDIQKDDSYLSTLSRSLALALDDYYQGLNVIHQIFYFHWKF